MLHVFFIGRMGRVIHIDPGPLPKFRVARIHRNHRAKPPIVDLLQLDETLFNLGHLGFPLGNQRQTFSIIAAAKISELVLVQRREVFSSLFASTQAGRF